MGSGQLFHALQRLYAALCLAGLGGLGLEARNVFLHVRTLHLLLLVGLLLLGQTFCASAFKGAVAPAIEGDLALLDVGDVIDHRIEKVPVVGNQQQGAGIALEPVLEPQNGVEVQVVGGLIEQQQV
ncbi:hypothetical protein ALP75_200190 [Pseudomonas syringae pv. actinidiae]|nr:hypothetical protein ALP75_200190 [Pseudomonas syringae pv. actinidiae]